MRSFPNAVGQPAHAELESDFFAPFAAVVRSRRRPQKNGRYSRVCHPPPAQHAPPFSPRDGAGCAHPRREAQRRPSRNRAASVAHLAFPPLTFSRPPLRAASRSRTRWPPPPPRRRATSPRPGRAAAPLRRREARLLRARPRRWAPESCATCCPATCGRRAPRSGPRLLTCAAWSSSLALRARAARRLTRRPRLLARPGVARGAV